MNLTIPVFHISAARKLLTRLRFERFTLPVLTHVLATIDTAGLTLAVTDLDHWLETRVPATIDPFTPGRFLIPAEALKAAARGDKGSSAHFAYAETADGTTLTLTTSCCGLSVKSVYHLAVTAEDFPARPIVEGRITAMPKETFAALGIVAGCASTDATRYVLNGVHFTPEDGGMLIATDGRTIGRRTRPRSQPGVRAAQRRRACARPSGLRHPRRRSPASGQDGGFTTSSSAPVRTRSSPKPSKATTRTTET